MTLILNGTDNSATTPAVTGTDTDTGVYYPAANQVAIATSGTQAMLANASQGVQFANAIGVGATTPTTSGAGITFPATQSASTDANTLDDYEEGTWTPAISLGTWTYGTRSGYYRKVGSMVTVWFSIIWSASSNPGAISVTGLPFTSRGATFRATGAYGYSVGVTFANANYTSLSWLISENYNTIDLANIGNGQSSSFVLTAASNGEVQGTISYIAVN
jgi:hypothetical protein